MRELQLKSEIRNPKSEIALAVKPDETKWETKIFAGGAVIARDGATGPQWVTADPVTGSSVTWRKIDSVWSTSVEETEPLGQKIYNADPDPIPDPTYENAMRNADFPQWQCAVPKEFYGRFTSMPMHCQLAVWKESGMKTPFEVEAEENVQEVTNHKSAANPGPSAGPSEGARGEDATAAQRAVHRLMTHALGSTRKPTTHTGEQTGDDDDDPIRVETHTSTATISNRGEKGSGIGKPLETGWVAAGTPTIGSFIVFGDEPYNLEDLISETRKKIEGAGEDCLKLLGSEALSQFDKIVKNIAYDNDGKNVGSADAITIGENIYLNAWSHIFNESRRTIYEEKKGLHKSTVARNAVIRDYQEDIKKRGITSLEYAIASLIHEFLHAIGKFPPDTRRTVYADGSVKTESKSMANQKKVLDNCFGKGGAK